MRNEIKADRTSAPATIVGQTTTLNELKRFKREILFEELTFELLTDFEKHLFSLGLHTNTVNKYFRHIRKFVNLAINKDLLELNRYPFRKFKTRTEETTREYLTPEDLTAIETVAISEDKKHLEKIRDMFLFLCYTGLRFSDISKLSTSDIQTVDGNKWIETTMQKTAKNERNAFDCIVSYFENKDRID